MGIRSLHRVVRIHDVKIYIVHKNKLLSINDWQQNNQNNAQTKLKIHLNTITPSKIRVRVS